MSIENRVLAYQRATELKNSELMAISGGSAKMTLQTVTLGTGYYPGPVDCETMQVWD